MVGLKKYFNLKIILIVLSLQTIISLFELINVIDCHNSTGECWPWFFTFSINLPISAEVMDVMHGLNESLSFYPKTFMTFFLFVFAGTFWWSLILHLFLLLFRGILKLTNVR